MILRTIIFILLGALAHAKGILRTEEELLAVSDWVAVATVTKTVKIDFNGDDELWRVNILPEVAAKTGNAEEIGFIYVFRKGIICPPSPKFKKGERFKFFLRRGDLSYGSLYILESYKYTKEPN
jgi:hypothetical protein